MYTVYDDFNEKKKTSVKYKLVGLLRLKKRKQKYYHSIENFNSFISQEDPRHKLYAYRVT